MAVRAAFAIMLNARDLLTTCARDPFATRGSLPERPRTTCGARCEALCHAFSRRFNQSRCPWRTLL